MEKKHKRNSKIYQAIQYFSMLIPYVIIVLVNKDVYFEKTTKISMTIGCVICLILALFVVLKKTQLLKGLGVFIIGFLLTFFMKPVIDDLIYIFLFGGIGYAVSLVFEKLSKRENELAGKYETSRINKE